MREMITGLVKDNGIITGVLLNQCPALMCPRLTYHSDDRILPVNKLKGMDINFLTTDQRRKDFEFYTLEDVRSALRCIRNSQNKYYFEELATYAANDISESISNPHYILANLRSEAQYVEPLRLYSPHGLKDFIEYLHKLNFSILPERCEVNNAVWTIYHHAIPGLTWEFEKYTLKFYSDRSGGN